MRGWGAEDDYDDLDSWHQRSIREVLLTNRVNLVGVSVLLLFVSCGSSAVTVGPDYSTGPSIAMALFHNRRVMCQRATISVVTDCERAR